MASADFTKVLIVRAHVHVFLCAFEGGGGVGERALKEEKNSILNTDEPR